MKADYIVVGSGLTGATIARLLADAGREVVVLERRKHVGGNVHDSVHECGVRVHTYGPHYFRTSSERVRDFALRFGEFWPYEARVRTYVDGEYRTWPPPNWGEPAMHGTPTNFEEAALCSMSYHNYHRFVKEYTEKQWDRNPQYLDAELFKRLPVRAGYDDRLTPDVKFQGIPRNGYARWTASILADIHVRTSFEYRTGDAVATKKLIYTGPIDAYFGYAYGALKYRGQRRQHVWTPEGLPYAQVNTPQHKYGTQVRLLDWRHMMPTDQLSKVAGTVITSETPCEALEQDLYEYPVPDARNQELYRKYRAMADSDSKLLVCGRLGEYKYYDMDQAIARAMLLAGRLLEEHP